MARLAAELGVSVSTVSNAYNRPEKLSSGVRDRVMSLAEELGYAGPDPLARSLRRQRTGGIGVVFTDDLPFVFTDPASAGFLAGVAQDLTDTGRHLVLLPAGTPDRRQQAPIDHGAVDGIIFHSLPRGEATLSLLQRRGTPAVLVDQPSPVPGIAWVGLDETASMQAMGAHLAALGHVHVGCITSRLGTAPHNGPASPSRASHSRFTIPRDRIHGLQQGLGHPVTIEERWDTTIGAGADATAHLLNRNPRITAIACIADTYALGALAWAGEHHVQVPNHLTITGYDDIPAAGSAGLTTMRQPFDLKGQTAARTLRGLIDGAEAPTTHTFKTMLVKRSSSGPRRL